ncbi:MAG: hypothetical protein GEU79_04945 [Acidimicrobiia bacterium]|nr:hypothetical protein [Acidimicrobiia bacterium]
MIVEVRTYTTKPGLRGRFLDFFKDEAVPLQLSLGIEIVGPFIDMEDADVFVWLRVFPSPAERDKMKEALYEGEKWKNELEAIAMPMLERYEVVVADVPDWFVNEMAVTHHRSNML